MVTTPPTLPTMRRPPSRAERQRRLMPLAHLAIIAVGAFFFVPFLWMFSTSLKTDSDLGRPLHWIPRDNVTTTLNGQTYPLYTRLEGGVQRRYALLDSSAGDGTFAPLENPTQRITAPVSDFQEVTQIAPQWQNFPAALEKIPFLTYAGNTLLIAVLGVIGTVLSCTVVAYGFSKINWPGRDVVFVVVLATMMLPPQVTLVPLYIVFTRTLGWANTIWPLVVPAFFANAFDIFLLRQFYRTIPNELLEAARMDGASEWGIFSRIVLPLSRPVIATVAVMSFLYAWNDLQGPLLYLNSPEKLTLSIGLLEYKTTHAVQWNLMMAAATIFAAPVIAMFFLTQRTFIEGVKLSGVKG
jgi:multiple sugar transport system permease protein